jgi:phenylalanine-4-hydroxylase
MALTQTQQFQSGMGLTTTKAPFIEVAHSRGELYIEQPYELYSEENHEVWRRLATLRHRSESVLIFAGAWAAGKLSPQPFA